MNARSITVTLVLAFIGGGLAVGWILSSGVLPWAVQKNEDTVIAQPASAPSPNPVNSYTPVLAQPVIVDNRRSEAMLLANQVRQLVDQGRPLGALSARIESTFGAVQPQVFATLNRASGQKLSNAALLAEFETLAPSLTRPAGTGWTRIQHEFSTLFVLRRSDKAPSPSSARVERVKQYLVAGDIAAAMRLVREMPGAANAADWLETASAAVAVRKALDQLDQAALQLTIAPAVTAPPVSGAPTESIPIEALPPE